MTNARVHDQAAVTSLTCGAQRGTEGFCRAIRPLLVFSTACARNGMAHDHALIRSPHKCESIRTFIRAYVGLGKSRGRGEVQIDCLIIRGGPAGLTAAIYLARFRLT
jgi:hypothetical protein